MRSDRHASIVASSQVARQASGHCPDTRTRLDGIALSTGTGCRWFCVVQATQSSARPARASVRAV